MQVVKGVRLDTNTSFLSQRKPPPVKTPIAPPTTHNTTTTSTSSYPPMNRNYTTWVPPLRKDNIGLNGYATKRPMGQFDYSMQFDSFEDAASEQERLLADSKKRVEARKEKEVRRAFYYILTCKGFRPPEC